MAVHKDCYTSLNLAQQGGLRRRETAHPRVRLDLRVGRSVEIAEAYRSGKLDIVIAVRQAVERDEAAVVSEAMQWLCAPGGPASPNEDLPLALLDPPCGFRDAALQALERTNRRHRIAATSSSLAGLQAAVRAGIAVTVRTARWIGPGIQKAPSRLQLPRLPKVEFSLRIHQGAEDATRRLAALLAEGMRQKQ
jgi:DNA-binding transcriptional LysR family regulator